MYSIFLNLSKKNHVHSHFMYRIEPISRIDKSKCSIDILLRKKSLLSQNVAALGSQVRLSLIIMETDVGIRIQETLISINDVTLKM